MRKLVSLFLVACLSVLAIPSSSAHVTIVSSFPEQFANVNPIPTEVWIEFSGELQTLDGEAVNSLEVVDSTGIAVNFEDPIISGGRISTKISGQSAAGVFTVKYRVVGDDGHVIEGDYTFNASRIMRQHNHQCQSVPHLKNLRFPPEGFCSERSFLCS